MNKNNNNQGWLRTVWEKHPTLVKLTAIYMCRYESPGKGTDGFTSPPKGWHSLVEQLPNSKYLTVTGGTEYKNLIDLRVIPNGVKSLLEVNDLHVCDHPAVGLTLLHGRSYSDRLSILCEIVRSQCVLMHHEALPCCTMATRGVLPQAHPFRRSCKASAEIRVRSGVKYESGIDDDGDDWCLGYTAEWL